MLGLYNKLLPQFIQFKSISTDPQFKGEITKTAQWLSETFQAYGFAVDVIKGYDNPIVVASYTAHPDYKTCLIYGHYDVQPADFSDGWFDNPFSVLQKNNRLYARGAIDNKGQVLVHIATIFELIKQKKLRYNIKFMIEGNEETGSPLLGKFIRDNKQLLMCDLVMISDGEVTATHPIIELGFRGGFNATLTIKTSHTDLHSGIYGGAAPNAIHELSNLIHNLFNKEGTINIAGFYNDVDVIPEKIIQQNKKILFSETEYKKTAGIKALKNNQYDVYTQIGLQPTIEVSGIDGGYTDEGYKNIIPHQATAKFNFRLVKSQNPRKIIALFQEYVKNAVPKYVEYNLQCHDPYDGIKLNVENEHVAKAEKLLRKAYAKQVFFKYSGGGLPIVTYFDTMLHVPQVLVPIANEDCGMHAANENFELDHLEKALKFSELFFSTS